MKERYAMDTTPQTAPACNLHALDAAQRAEHTRLAHHLHILAHETRELPDGYAVRYPADALPTVAAFVALERRCCPFFRFALTLDPADGPLHLSITGPAGTKAILAAETGLL